ncbi:hypothetical protein L1286_12860 [Pseudoalteromonas sp. SMS1]|uniref:hypothetical protein n=1 Tax=Pseudoalteromonas sp. SMS1 TaxID=2908894 RepID=UPI001F318525|nr:hypothetical protein [Pseudoalteromonas sp. SMS1]MCF2858371.1 hypothetical protein [Pseudoalteromonas sp. SMS1]
MNILLIIVLGILTLVTIRNFMMLLGSVIRRENIKVKRIIFAFLLFFMLFFSFVVVFNNPDVFNIKKIDVHEERAKRDRGEEYVGQH